jgi:hypothetical protein
VQPAKLNLYINKRPVCGSGESKLNDHFWLWAAKDFGVGSRQSIGFAYHRKR